MIRLVLWDIDGTLCITSRAGVKAFKKVFETEFGTSDGFERLKFAGRTDVSLVREFFSFHNIPPTQDNFERHFEMYVFWLDHILAQSHAHPCPGVWEMLHAMRALPQPPMLGLLTGNIQLGAEIKLRHLDLWKMFEVGGFADDHEDRDKIAAAARDKGSRVLGRKLSGNEVLVIGDTPLDVRCARAINAKVVAVATGGHPLDELRQHKPDWAVEDLTKISARELCA